MDQPPPGRSTTRSVVGALVGAVLGFALGAAVYLVLDSVLEGSGSWIEELQGLAWNLVPLGTIAGAVTGYVVARRR